HFLEGDDGGVLGAVRSGNQRQHRPRLRAADNSDWNESSRVGTGGNFQEACSLLSRRGDGCAHAETTLGESGRRHQEPGKEETNLFAMFHSAQEYKSELSRPA